MNLHCIISRRLEICSTGTSGPAAHRLHQMSLVLEPVMSGLREPRHWHKTCVQEIAFIQHIV
jgi:hypothetical protein